MFSRIQSLQYAIALLTLGKATKLLVAFPDFLVHQSINAARNPFCRDARCIKVTGKQGLEPREP